MEKRPIQYFEKFCKKYALNLQFDFIQRAHAFAGAHNKIVHHLIEHKKIVFLILAKKRDSIESKKTKAFYEIESDVMNSTENIVTVVTHPTTRSSVCYSHVTKFSRIACINVILWK